MSILSLTRLRKPLVCAMFSALALGTAGLATAASKGKNHEPAKAGAASTKGNSAALAQQLARYGDKNKDAMAMIMAARLQNEAGVRDTELAKAGKPTESSKKAADYSSKALLERAKQYAGDRKDLIALADDAASGARGRVEGPFRGQTVVKGGYTDTISVTLDGGSSALIAISGDGDSDLDLYVYDESGNRVCSSTSNGDDEYCRFTPKWTGKFRVKVQNNGKIDNRYTLLFN